MAPAGDTGPVSPYSPPNLSRLSAKNAAATSAAVEPHLEPGEQALVEQPVRPKGGWRSLLTFPRIQVTPPTVELPGLGVFAVTPRRFLLVSYHPGTDEATALVATRPLDEVRDVRVAGAVVAKELSFTTGGARYTLWVNPSMAKKIAQALQPERED